MSCFMIGMIVQTQISITRLHKIHAGYGFGNAEYDAIWYIITGNKTETL